MQQPVVYQRTNPQAAFAITEQPKRLKRQPDGKRIRLGFAVLQLGDASTLGNQDSAVVALTQRVDSLCRIWHGIELGWTRLPSPQAVARSSPDVAPAIFIQRGHSVAETPVRSVTLDVAALNPAESPYRRCPAGDPDRSLVIFKQRFNDLAIEFSVASELAVFPTCQSVKGANPETSVTRGLQSGYLYHYAFAMIVGLAALVGWIVFRP